MRIEYDPEADALYIHLREVSVGDSVDIEQGVTVDLDTDGHIIGVEILDASLRFNREELGKVSIENLLSAGAGS